MSFDLPNRGGDGVALRQKVGPADLDTVLDSVALRRQVEDLFRQLRKPVYSYLYALVGDPWEAEDLTQDAFLRLHDRLRRGDEIRNMRAWIFRVAHNLAIDSHRRPKHQDIETLSTADMGTVQASDEDTERGILLDEQDRQRKAWLALALRRLSPQERLCLQLRIEGLRYREIAEILGVGISTVESALVRALHKMARPTYEKQGKGI
jgi:RNA polymerase sigma-70 factor (ECF subfamily)